MEQRIVRAVIQDVLITGEITPGTQLLFQYPIKCLSSVAYWLYQHCRVFDTPYGTSPIDKIRLYLADLPTRRYILYATGITGLPPFDPVDVKDRFRLLSIAAHIGNYRDAWKLLQGRHLISAKVDFGRFIDYQNFDMLKLLCRYGVVEPFNLMMGLVYQASLGQSQDAHYDFIKYLLSAKRIRGLSDLLYPAYNRGRLDIVEAILATKPKNLEIALDHAVQAGNLAAIEYFYAITGQFTPRQVKMAGLGGKKAVIQHIMQVREIVLDRLLIDVIANIGTHIQRFYGAILLNLKLFEPIYTLVELGASKDICLREVAKYPLMTSSVAERLANL